MRMGTKDVHNSIAVAKPEGSPDSSSIRGIVVQLYTGILCSPEEGGSQLVTHSNKEESQEKRQGIEEYMQQDSICRGAYKCCKTIKKNKDKLEIPENNYFEAKKE